MGAKFAMSKESRRYVCAARTAELEASGCLVVQVEGHALALFAYGDKIRSEERRVGKECRL